MKVVREMGNMTVEIEGDNHIDLFGKISSFEEVFNDKASATIDGKYYESSDVRYMVRRAKYQDEKGKEKEANYYEKVVVSGPLRGFKKCYGVLDNGSGNLFPKKAPDSGVKVYGYNGWFLHEAVKNAG
jgi:hypothetical protein